MTRRTSFRRPGSRRAWARRIHSIALAFLLVASQLAGLLHVSLVEHRVCDSDGELCHGHEASAEPADGAARPILTDAGGEAAGGHEHCSLANHLRQKDAAPELGLEVRCAVLAAGPPRLAFVEREPALEFPLFLLAPKHSPPSAG